MCFGSNYTQWRASAGYLAFLLLGCLAIAGCSSKEYRAMKYDCKERAKNKFPPSFESYAATCYRNKTVPTGRVNCNVFDRMSGAYVQCNEVTQTVRESYSCEKTRDRNLRSRNEFVSQCTRDRCTTVYGNPKCE